MKTEWYTDEHGVKWIKDANENRCSTVYFGSEERAQKALESLENCRNCKNCSDCFDCSRCSDCSDCSDCSNVANLDRKKDLKDGPESAWSGPPPISKIENIHQKVYEAASKEGALNMKAWHTCGTTHCRGGWVVHLAGGAGYALKYFYGDLLAAQLIYRESGYQINPCRFFDLDKDALADMKRLAEKEAKAA